MKIGIIGAGRQAERIGDAIFENENGVIAVITDEDKQKSEKLAKKYGCESLQDYKQVINSGVDAVVICTPPKTHAEISILAMRNGIHVLCEKPMAYSLEEAKNMVEISEEYNVILQIGFNLKFHPAIKQIKKWYDDGSIGEVKFIRAIYGIGARPDIKAEWRSDPNIISGGQLMEQGIHCIDLMKLFIENPSEVFCFTSNPNSIIEPLEDSAFVTFRTEKSQLVNIHTTVFQWKNKFTFEVFGTEGYVIAEGLGGSYQLEKAILGKRDPIAPFEEKIVEYRGKDSSWKLQWEDFFQNIKLKIEPNNSGKNGFDTLRLVFAAYESQKTKRSIDI
tara:strand:+ start:75 stop:1073 length:999 start_codon:yes stop_codon:yes gene_type:complete